MKFSENEEKTIRFPFPQQRYPGLLINAMINEQTRVI